MRVDRRPRVLVLSRNYPNDVQKLLGMWVRQIMAASAEICDPKVIAPEAGRRPSRLDAVSSLLTKRRLIGGERRRRGHVA
jgi:hypothetical protein